MNLNENTEPNPHRRPRRASPTTPFELVVRLHDERSSETKQENQERFVDAAIDMNDERMLRIVLADWHSRHYNTIVGTPSARPPEQRRSEREALAKQAEELFKRKNRLTHATIMPDGRAFGEWTAENCSALGGGLAKIAKEMKPGQTVSDAFTETALAKIQA